MPSVFCPHLNTNFSSIAKLSNMFYSLNLVIKCETAQSALSSKIKRKKKQHPNYWIQFSDIFLVWKPNNYAIIYAYICICTYIHMYLITVSNMSKNLWKKSGNCQSYLFFLPRYSGIDTECNRSWWFSQLVMLELPPIEGKEIPPF